MTKRPKRTRARTHIGLPPCPVPAHSGASLGTVVRGNQVIWVWCDPHTPRLQRGQQALTTGLPTHPYHHEGAWAQGRYLSSPWARPTTWEEAFSLIEQVTAQATLGAVSLLQTLLVNTPKLERVAVRTFAGFTDSISERLRSVALQTQADNVMYRQAIATAAKQLGLRVVSYDHQRVLADSGQRLLTHWSVHDYKALRSVVGAPWTHDHHLALAAALACLDTE
jgi:hypothetical protein